MLWALTAVQILLQVGILALLLLGGRAARDGRGPRQPQRERRGPEAERFEKRFLEGMESIMNYDETVARRAGKQNE